MRYFFKDFLLKTKRIFVNDYSEKNDEIDKGYTLFSLAKLFAIKITSGEELLNSDMIKYAEVKFKTSVPQHFYKGFPQSVKQLTADELLLEQIVNYFLIYDLGVFTEEIHSVFEKITERLPYNERYLTQGYSVITEVKAQEMLYEYVDALLASTRPLSGLQYMLVRFFVEEYKYYTPVPASKDTTVKLLADTGNLDYTDSLALSDVIRLVDHINRTRYRKRSVYKLNLKNKDRKFITAVMDKIFDSGYCDVKTCCEKRKAWCGLLHHIHYKPKNETAEKFVSCIRSGEN